MIFYASDQEIIVCSKKNERQMLIDYFEKGGRDRDDFDREVVKGVIQIRTSLVVR